MVNKSTSSATDDSAWLSQTRDVTDRRHAVYAIARSLDLLQQPGWTHTLLVWLANYDGFEDYLPEADDPVLSVRNLLTSYVTRNRPLEMGRLAVDLCGMPFLNHRAAWVMESPDQRSKRDWMPLTQPWLEFVSEQSAGEELRVWQAAEAFPPPDVLRSWLLNGFVTRTKPFGSGPGRRQ